MESKNVIATTPGLLPIHCPKCKEQCVAEMADELDRLVSQCCGATIPGTERQPPETEG